MIRIAIIDDGINEDVFTIGILQDNLEILPHMNIINRSNYNKSIISHGTICAAIIKKYAPDAPLTSIKILNSKNNRCNKKQLIEALLLCAKKKRINIINLSIGSVDYRDYEEIKECVNTVIKYGCIIIAACNNKNIYTVPASLSNVIGVRCDNELIDDQYKFHKYALDGIDISSSGKQNLNNYLSQASNSYAAPVITAKVFGILMKNLNIRLSLEDIKFELFTDALNNKDSNYNPYIQTCIDWIGKYIIINNNSMLSNDSFKNSEYQTAIINLAKYDYIKKNARDKIFNNIIENKKNVVILSEQQSDYCLSYIPKRIKIWHSDFYKNILNYAFKGQVFNYINIPIILFRNKYNSEIFLNLNKLFRREGYYSIIVSDEKEDILKGCMYLPQGVNSKELLSYICLKYNCDLILLNARNLDITKVIEKDIDILISTSQSKNVKLSVRNQQRMNFNSINLLYNKIKEILE